MKAAIAELNDLLGGRRLVVVSNREPYEHRRTAGGVKVAHPSGGVVAALDPVMQASGGTWIAWGSGDADFEVTDARGRVRIPPDSGAYTLKRIALTEDEVEGYYYEYSNQALWPLCHMAMAHARFRRRPWELYQAANRRFADAVLEEADPDALVWLHDYHLALVPRYVRTRRPEQFVMHFWHIPWPAWDIFRACPQRAEILEGLLAADFVGFQHPRHVEHFLECAERELGAPVDRDEGVVEHDGRVTHVDALPISVDFAALDAQARSTECERWMSHLRKRHGLGGKVVALGVDRLDYTKGIPERLRALDRLFERFPDYRGRLVFIQKSAPSRTRIRAYRDLQREIEREVARLNAVWGSGRWRPVIHLSRPLPPAGLAALYRLADLCIVSSLQDGMNLVAKEYVACQVDRRGVLLLSELAGAHDELAWAIPINPYDAGGTAATIAHAAEMPASERAERLDHLRAYVAEHDIYEWMRRHVRTAAHLLAARASTRWISDRGDEIRERIVGRSRLALLLDFDGTLAPIVSAPEEASLPDAVRDTLERLAGVPQILVMVMSGRTLDDIRRRVAIHGIVHAGNHGLEIAGPRWAWIHPQAEEARPLVAEACARLGERLGAIPGVVIEDKRLTASVHYRLTPHPYIETVRMAVYEEADRSAGGLVVRQGKKVFELRPYVAWDKGRAARWMLGRAVGDRWAEETAILYIGDDRTDEDAFLALPEPAVTVKVGANPASTAARYAARDVHEVGEFLQQLAAWLGVDRGPREVAKRMRS
jgi:trehalose 6-phosphate synthase